MHYAEPIKIIPFSAGTGCGGPALQKEIPYADQIQMIPFSAETGYGVPELRAIVEEIAQLDLETEDAPEEGTQAEEE